MSWTFFSLGIFYSKSLSYLHIYKRVTVPMVFNPYKNTTIRQNTYNFTNLTFYNPILFRLSRDDDVINNEIFVCGQTWTPLRDKKLLSLWSKSIGRSSGFLYRDVISLPRY